MRSASLTVLFIGLVLTAFAAHAQAPSCEAMQKALYSKPVVRVKMVFGYKDARPARFVGDRHERLAFVEKLTAPCEGKEEACGFVRSADDADLFMKEKFRVWVVNSSVGTDDEENRSDPFQEWKSQYAQDTFLDGLKNADVVFYNGHSRFGGGPDFRSPRLAADGTVDPTSYQNQKRGIAKLTTALKESKRPKASNFSNLKVLGLFSCSSSQHFNTQIRKVSEAGLISSNVLMYYSDALTQSMSALDALMRKQCPKALAFR